MFSKMWNETKQKQGWQVKRLKDIAHITMGQSPKSESYNKQKKGIPLIQGKADCENRCTQPKLWTTDITKTCDVGDIIMTVRAPVGYIAKSSHYACIGRGVCSIRAKQNQDYLYYYLIHCEDRWKRIAQGSTFEAINRGDIENMKILLPSIKEQQKIAAILATWDRAIALKERLVEQKRAQKKGLMQKLLAGEIRLPGFNGPWKEVTLGELGEFKTSSVNKKSNQDEVGVSIINYMDVYRNGIIDESIDLMQVTASEKQIETFAVQYGDVLFTPSSETPDDIGHSAVVKMHADKTLFSYHLVRLRFKREMDIDFKAYVFQSPSLLREFSRRATGVTRYTLSLSDFRESSIQIPKDLKEQKAIADLLIKSDREIQLLEQEITQLQLQKKGLIQRLLTGEIRAFHI